MSFRQWVLTQQAYKRNELTRLQRMLMLVNVWADEEVTLHDVVGAGPAQRTIHTDDRFKRHVMERRNATHDLTNNRFSS